MLLELLTTLKHATAALLLILAEASGEPARTPIEPPPAAPVEAPHPAWGTQACPSAHIGSGVRTNRGPGSALCPTPARVVVLEDGPRAVQFRRMIRRSPVAG
jgi:hypothetical protein